MKTPEIRVGQDYFAIDYYPDVTLVSTVLFIPIRRVEWFPDEARTVGLDVAAEEFVARYEDSLRKWTEYWRELRKA